MDDAKRIRKLKREVRRLRAPHRPLTVAEARGVAQQRVDPSVFALLERHNARMWVEPGKNGSYTIHMG